MAVFFSKLVHAQRITIFVNGFEKPPVCCNFVANKKYVFHFQKTFFKTQKIN